MKLLAQIRKQKTKGRCKWFVVTMERSYLWRCMWICCNAFAVHLFIHDSKERIIEFAYAAVLFKVVNTCRNTL